MNTVPRMKGTHKNCKCLSSPSSGPKVPEMLEKPKSLQWKISLPEKNTSNSDKNKINNNNNESILQANNVVIVIAGDMKPGTRINKSRIPTPKNIFRVRKSTPQSMQCVPWNSRLESIGDWKESKKSPLMENPSKTVN